MEQRAGGKIYRSASEWEEILRRFESSGQSAAAFCVSEGLSGSSLHKWRRKLRGESDFRPEFVEAKVISRKPSAGVYEIRLKSGRGIVLTSGFEAAMLGELIRLVERC